jgi:hypothetical protein
MKSEKAEELSEAVSHLLEECRMVLPGIQALFGFQLVAVFNQRFEKISSFDQYLHLAATFVVAISAGLVMTPAAFHREVEPSAVSQKLVTLSTRLLLISMGLLSVGIALDFFVIAALVVETPIAAAAIASGLFVSVTFLWFVFPFLASGRGSRLWRRRHSATQT